MATTAAIQAQLDACNTAINAILAGMQRMSHGDREYQMARLSDLEKIQSRLERRLARVASGGMTSSKYPPP